MSQFVSIGRFAQLCRLTPRALRLYDELGLLRPARVDEATSYRLYHLDQLDAARRIASLRALGVPLEEIRRSERALTAVLQRHRAALQGQLQVTNERLAEVDRLLREVCMESTTYEVSLRSEVARRVLFVRERVVLPETDGVLRRAMNEVCAFAARANVNVDGAPWCAYEVPDVSDVAPPSADEAVPVDCVVPIATEVSGDDRVRFAVLPACDVAFTRHVGPYSALSEAFQAVARWVADHGFEIDGPLREVYLEHDPGPAERHVVEIVFPVRAASE